MPTYIKTLDVPLAEAKILNAKRYGLSEKDLNQFSDLMKTFGKKTTNLQEGGTKDTAETSTQDLIKDYVKQRMTDRMSASMKDRQYLGSQTPNFDTNPQDFILDMVGTPRPKSNDVSGLLNMHFDLNTLQMLA